MSCIKKKKIYIYIMTSYYYFYYKYKKYSPVETDFVMFAVMGYVVKPVDDRLKDELGSIVSGRDVEK